MTQTASCSLPSGPQPLPPPRMSAGIEASMMTSDGTCRLVMPLSLSTMYMGGRSAVTASIAAMISGSSLTLSSSVPRPAFPVTPSSSSLSPYFSNTGASHCLHRVAEDDRVRDLHHRGLHVQREQDALGLRLLDLFGRNASSAAALMNVASTTVPAGS
jgi:hypothetical protein